MFNYNHLFYFYMTAKLGGVSRAARALHISQPSLSAQLKLLEHHLGTKLFERKGRNNELSEGAKYVYGYCRTMFSAAEELQDFLKLGSGKLAATSRQLSVGVSDEIERPFIARLIGDIMRKEKGVGPRVTLLTGPSRNLGRELKGSALDCLISNSPLSEDGLSQLLSVKVPVVLIGGRGARLSKKAGRGMRNVALSFCQSAGWVLPSPRHRLRIETERALGSQTGYRIVFESDVLAALVAAIAEDVGVGLLPLCYVAPDIRDGKIRLLDRKAYWTHPLWLYTRKGHERSADLQGLLRVFKSTLERDNALIT